MIVIKLSTENFARVLQIQWLCWSEQPKHSEGFNPSIAIRQYASGLVS